MIHLTGLWLDFSFTSDSTLCLGKKKQNPTISGSVWSNFTAWSYANVACFLPAERMSVPRWGGFHVSGFLRRKSSLPAGCVWFHTLGDAYLEVLPVTDLHDNSSPPLLQPHGWNAVVVTWRETGNSVFLLTKKLFWRISLWMS